MRRIKLLIIACLFALTLAAPIFSQVQLGSRQTGRLLSVEISGQGPDANSKARFPAVWWTYCVCGQDRTYYAVLRKSSEGAGLTVNTIVNFSVDRNRLYLMSSKGRHVLRIFRQDKRKTCR